MIKVSGLTKAFQGFKALDNVDLHIEKGSVYGLVGPNGAGKTTLIKHIVGVYIADKGNVSINGKNVYDNDIVKQNIVYIPDDLYFPLSFTVKDMAKLYSGIYENFSWERFKEFGQLFEIEEKRTVSKLSKGMQKQVAFWICMSTNPEVIILDEPVDGLDPVMRRKVWSVILSDVEKNNTTVLISSHNLRELEDVCDHVGILHKGKVVLEKALDDMKSDTHKIQVAFNDEIPDELLKSLNVLNESKMGRMNLLIVRGNSDDILDKINNYNPILVDMLPLTLEEVFIYELGGMGYDFKNILN